MRAAAVFFFVDEGEVAVVSRLFGFVGRLVYVLR